MQMEVPMLCQPDFTQTKPRTYEQIGHRIQRIISDPNVQKIQMVTIHRLPNESEADWVRLLKEISETAGIRVDQAEDGAMRIGWREYCEG
jgi:cyanophycinase-like exopeptidase